VHIELPFLRNCSPNGSCAVPPAHWEVGLVAGGPSVDVMLLLALLFIYNAGICPRWLVDR
jgi:hypothetical protein